MKRETAVCLACLACMALALAGCNQPAVMSKPLAFQSSANTVRDWGDVAHRIVEAMGALGLVPGPDQPVTPKRSPLPPVFIRVQAPDSAFIRQVANTLAIEISNRGGTVVLTPNDATVVNLDVDFVRWGPRDKPPGLGFTTAGLLAVPGIVEAASSPLSTWTAAGAASLSAVGLGVLADTLIGLWPTMNAEAIWQAEIVASDRIVMKLDEPIYIRAMDIPLYSKMTSLNPVSSWTSATPIRSRMFRYDP